MAIFRPGPLVGGISGSLGGVTFVTSRTRQVVRKRPAKINQQTGPQLAARNFHVAMQRAWQDFSQSTRDAYNAIAPTIPYIDRLGVTRYYSGVQLFMKQRAIRRTTFVQTDQVPVFAEVPGPINPTWSADAGGPFDYDADNWIRDQTAVAVVWFARPFTGKSLKALPIWTRYPIEIQPSIIGGATDMEPFFTATHGSPAAGETIGMRIAYWNVTGLLSNKVDLIVQVQP